MNKAVAIALAAFLIGGCAPKMGEDILVEPQGGIRWENTGADVVLGVLAILGAPVAKEPIRIGSDLKVANRWHSSLKVVSLTYALKEGDAVFAEGNGKIGKEGYVVIPSGGETILPLMLKIDPAELSPSRLVGIYQGKQKVMLKGDLVIEVWGIRRHYPFEKDATALIRKVLSKNGF